MTTLGKILVFVNLLFSMVTGFLIIMVFLTRTNWKTGFDELEKNLKVANANVKAFAERAEAIKKEKDEERTNADREKATLLKQVNDLKKEVVDAKTALQTEEAKTRDATTTSQGSTEESKRRQNEVDRMVAVMAERDKKILELEGDVKKSRDEAILANKNFEEERNRSVSLLTRVQELEKSLDLARHGGSPTMTTSLKPPPEDVQGRVKESDPRTGLVTISIGSDSGILKGHKLEVYRFQPKPDYVGMIQIVDSRHHEAVGRVLPPLRAGAAPIQVGDHVASRIVLR